MKQPTSTKFRTRNPAANSATPKPQSTLAKPTTLQELKLSEDRRLQRTFDTVRQSVRAASVVSQQDKLAVPRKVDTEDS